MDKFHKVNPSIMIKDNHVYKSNSLFEDLVNLSQSELVHTDVLKIFMKQNKTNFNSLNEINTGKIYIVTSLEMILTNLEVSNRQLWLKENDQIVKFDVKV